RIAHLRALDPERFDGLYFRREVKLMQRESIADGPKDDDVIPPVVRPTGDSASPALTQRGHEQRKGLSPTLVRRQIVGPLEINRIDGGERHELRDVDTVTAGLLQRLQLLGSEHHVLVLGELVALDDLLPPDHLLLLLANILLLQPRAILRMQQVKAHPLRADRRRVQLYRDRHQSEGDREG